MPIRSRPVTRRKDCEHWSLQSSFYFLPAGRSCSADYFLREGRGWRDLWLSAPPFSSSFFQWRTLSREGLERENYSYIEQPRLFWMYTKKYVLFVKLFIKTTSLWSCLLLGGGEKSQASPLLRLHYHANDSQLSFFSLFLLLTGPMNPSPC